MSAISPYQLFVSSDCGDCDKILAFIKAKEINITTTIADKEEYQLPFSLMIFPALILNNKLVSYGYEDIATKLTKN
jgi:hypothetical protein